MLMALASTAEKWQALHNSKPCYRDYILAPLVEGAGC